MKIIKNNIILYLLIGLSFNVFSQDTIIYTDSYTSYFDTTYKQPLYVSYKLYKGGGDVSRKGMNFKGIKNITCTDKDYYKSGYDRGHLVNAEDFAYDSIKLESTFRYYNCLPQTSNLNRGIWKKYESLIRDLSYTDSLLIICGGSHFIKNEKLYVPQYCWKIVYSLSNNNIEYVILFTNKESDNSYTLYPNVIELENNLNIKINL